MDNIRLFMEKYLTGLTLPVVKVTDIIEIIILSFLVYQIMIWVKNTRAWMVFKGIIVLIGFLLFAYIFQMTTILWIAQNSLGVIITAVIIVFQPELRKALEQLGRKNFITSIFAADVGKREEEGFSDKIISEIAKAVFEMSKVKTGALIVVERKVGLSEYERTGIELDAIVTSQLLINIFEHNTPLHDGAIIIRGNRIVSATCYLPLSDNTELSKDLGTRHRAGVGISEVTDSVTVIVSEETGKVSAASGGKLVRNLDSEHLKEELAAVQINPIEIRRFSKWKGWLKNESKSDK